jgi:hypothetical protein
MTREPPALEHSKARMVVDDDDDLVAKAAPDLLVAAKNALRVFSLLDKAGVKEMEAVYLLTNAIAKAEGRA